MNDQQSKLKKDLKIRHITMISLGGIIGAGLFVGSGTVINTTGPSAILSYLLGGILVILIMRMLGEMSSVNPSTGSFSTYAREAIGPCAGFTIGWLYWFFWVIVIAVEATAGASIIQYWLPSVPLWLTSLLITILLTITNIFSVKSFGEFEYWFALIKVISILLFIILGVTIILGLIPNVDAPGLTNLTGRGGFMPNGVSSVLMGVAVVMFSFVGTEIVASAAGETSQPQKAIRIATNTVIFRILLFNIGSILVLITLLPWDSKTLLKSPFVSILELVNLPAAAQIMNIIILTAVLSCLNAGLYTSSRMLFSMAQNGDSPRLFLKVNKNGIPVYAILGCTIFSYIGIIFNYISPDKVFLFLVNSSGAIALFVYLVIAISQLRLRKKLEKEQLDSLKVKMWFFPHLTYLTIFAIISVLVAMIFIDSLRSQFYLTSLFALIVIGTFYLFKYKKTSGGTASEKEKNLTSSIHIKG